MKWFFATLLHPFITLCKNVIGDHYCMQQQRKWALPFVKNFHFLTDPWQKSERARGNWTMNRFARSLLLYHNGPFHLCTLFWIFLSYILSLICLFDLFVWTGVRIHDRKASEPMATEPWIFSHNAYYYTTMDRFNYNVRFFLHFHFSYCVWLFVCLIWGLAIKLTTIPLWTISSVYTFSKFPFAFLVVRMDAVRKQWVSLYDRKL